MTNIVFNIGANFQLTHEYGKVNFQNISLNKRLPLFCCLDNLTDLGDFGSFSQLIIRELTAAQNLNKNLANSRRDFLTSFIYIYIYIIIYIQEILLLGNFKLTT